MAGRLAAIDPVLRLAEESDGFCWRHGDDHGRRVTLRPDGASTLVVNVSTRVSYGALHRFTYHSSHGAFVRRRATWFVATPQPSTALWRVCAGTRPTAEEALRRLTVLRRFGPAPRAFGLRHRCAPDRTRSR